MSSGAQPLSCVVDRGTSCELSIHVVPQASRTAVAGLHDGALRVRLAAAPIEGRANAALLKWLCEQLDLGRREVQLVAGDSSRRKRVRLACQPDRVRAWVASSLQAAGNA